jgi:hypothetical protein
MTDNSWIPEYGRILTGLQTTAAAARRLAELIRKWFPLEGQPWPSGHMRHGGTMVSTVLNAAIDLDRLIYPLRLPLDATLADEVRLLNDGTPPKLPEEYLRQLDVPFRETDAATRYMLAVHVGGPGDIVRYLRTVEAGGAIGQVPEEVWAEVEGVREGHDQILGHYGWRERVTGKSNHLPWTWPNVPPVPPSLLALLSRAADDLADVVAKERAMVENLTQEGTTPPQETPDTVPCNWPASSPDLAKSLRDMGYEGASDDAVDHFLRKLRKKYDDSYVTWDPADRRRNEPKYSYRAEVWPDLVQHFSKPR